MFENVLGHTRLVERLSSDIRKDVFPGSVLFSGPAFSGKLTVALETARVLTCFGKGEWGCTCGSCAKHRSLIHPDVVLAGPKYFGDEVAACAAVFLKHDQNFARFLFLRSIRKLTRRFDPFLWEGETKAISRVRDEIGELEDLADGLEPGLALEESKDEIVTRAVTLARSVTSKVNLDQIPAGHVRKIEYWAHTSGRSGRKIVIFENADAMNDSARNALLKTLEEPPENVTFILLTGRKGAMIETILSRLRVYEFAPRDAVQSSRVLERIFRLEPGQHATLDEFFSSRSVDPDELRRHVDLFWALAQERASESGWRDSLNWAVRDRHFPALLRGILRRIPGRDSFEHSGEGLADLGAHRARTLERVTRLVNDAHRRFEVLNQNPELLLDELLQRTREVVR